MATSTSKLGLTKPALTDNVDVTVLNTNFDEIDTAAGFSIVTSATRPASPWAGQIIYETDTESSFVWDGSAWQGVGGGGSIEIAATAPSSPNSGDLWWDSDNGNLYIYYDDGDSQQWVAANGPQVFVGTSAPAGYQGQLWFDSTEGKTYVYYDDGSSAQWVSAIGGSTAGSIIAVKDVLKTDTFSASVAAGGNVAVTDLSITHEVANASNKLIITAVFGVAGDSGQAGKVGIGVHDGSSLIGVGDSAGSRTQVSAGGVVDIAGTAETVASHSVTFVYTPGSGSKTYTVRAINPRSSSTTLYINRSEGDVDTVGYTRGVSSLVIQEVAV
jgi:hypothetical protein